jgi:hypothetical protein
MHNVIMRGVKHQSGSLRPGQIQFSRGHWRHDTATGTIRSEGWWESVTVTFSAAPAEQRPALLRRALAAAWDTIAPSAADLVTASARRLIERRAGRRTAFPAPRKVLPAVARQLPRSDRPADR